MFDSLPGFREFLPDSCGVRNTIFNVLRSTAERYNFLEYDAPLLEPLELYIEKSGPEIVSQLFNFEDKGGRAVALRPEMTPTLARLVGARANSMKRPIKWFSIVENFRYEKPQKGRTHSFYQYNADILGDASPGADAELILLLIASLKRFGLNETDFVVRLSDRQMWVAFLESWDLSDTAVAEVLGIVDKMQRVERQVTLEKLGKCVSEPEALLSDIEKLIQVRSIDALESFLAATDYKFSERLEDLRILVQRLSAAGMDGFVQLDFGIVRGLAYYTGFVYEAFERSGESRALAGGGRYDELVKKMGGPDLPAAGFAMGDVTLRDCLEEKGLIGPSTPEPSVYMVVGGEAEMAACLKDVTRLREQGFRVEYPFKPAGFGKQFKNAEKSGAKYAVVYGEDEIKSGALTVKVLASGDSVTVPRDTLIRWLSDQGVRDL